MRKKSDKIFLDITIGILAILSASLLLEGTIEILLISFFIFIVYKSVFVHLHNRHGNLKNINVEETVNYFALIGNVDTIKYMLPLIPSVYQPIVKNNAIIVTLEQSKRLLFFEFKFSDLGYEDIAKMYRLSNEIGVKDINVYTKDIKRNILIFSKKLPIDITFVETKVFYKKLHGCNALPTLPYKYKFNKPKLNLHAISSIILERKRLKYYLLSGFLMLALGTITPLKSYYYVMAIISFVLAGATLVKKIFT